MRILEKEIKYIDKLIAKTERSITWAEGKPGVSPVELQNLRFRLQLEKNIREVLCERVVEELRIGALKKELESGKKRCSCCYHHEACLHLIVPEDETLVLCENFVPRHEVTVLPLSLGVTVYTKKGIPYTIYKVEGDGGAGELEYTAWNGMCTKAGESAHLYFYPCDVGVTVFLENPVPEGGGADELR